MQIISSDTKQDPSTQCIQCNLYHLPHLNQPKKYQTRSYKYLMSSCISTSWTAQLVNLISCTNHATCTVTWAGHIDFTHYLHQLRLINSPWRDKEALPPRWIVSSSLLLLLLVQPLACQIKFNSKLVSALFHNNVIPLSAFKPPALLIVATKKKTRKLWRNSKILNKGQQMDNKIGRGNRKWKTWKAREEKN